MIVCIQRDDSGNFSVYTQDESLQKSQSAQQNTQTDSDQGDQSGAQQTTDLKSALLIAAKMLSQSDNEQKQSMFDQGLQRTRPAPRGGHAQGGI